MFVFAKRGKKLQYGAQGKEHRFFVEGRKYLSKQRKVFHTLFPVNANHDDNLRLGALPEEVRRAVFLRYLEKQYGIKENWQKDQPTRKKQKKGRGLNLDDIPPLISFCAAIYSMDMKLIEQQQPLLYEFVVVFLLSQLLRDQDITSAFPSGSVSPPVLALASAFGIDVRISFVLCVCGSSLFSVR